ncbi:apolipoprotein N-acyltransferase [Roseomonas sp. OT10]|uniref:apolipoprotein N-acyltransferase n=1 Tax=Roseomonas cutis TaxID=2897332 RepID=UPI001E55DE21|nr:apolipoprotein N-acyltransferase [Roseomonas sp. OT10]UFN48680.1 apolipoprotein N-acyltransferase [Roseomonas sp. OT10]
MFSRILRHLEGRRGWRAPATAVGLGALSALAMPPVHLLPVLWLTLPGFLWLAAHAPDRKRAALVGLAWGWGFQLAGLYWITEAILTEADRLWWLVPLAVPALALPMGAFSVLPALAAWGAPAGWRRVTGFAAAWVGAEMLRGWAFTGFPWNLLGTAWAFDALPLQGAAWIGVHGLSLVTVLLACAPLGGRRGWLGAAAGLVAFGLFGLARLWPEEPAPHPISLVLVQGNIGQEMKWRPETRWPIFRRYLELTRDGVAEAAAQAPGTRAVAIWPETASPFLLNEDAEARRFAAAALPADGVLLAGSVRAELEPDGRARAVFNSLVALDATGDILGRYDKSHLVPFGEYMPLSGLLPLRVIRGGMDFTAGAGPVTVDVGGLPGFSPLICYEVIFPGAVVSASRPEWLTNITNDAWFGTSAGPYQHLAAARLRSVEEGLPMARVAQTGISAVMDGRGRFVGRLGLGQTGVLVAPLPRAMPATPFSRYGLWLPGALVLLMTALSFAPGLRRHPDT